MYALGVQLETVLFLDLDSQNVGQLLSTTLPVGLHPAIPYLSPYFLTSFGSFQRMDYGSGHETSFAIFLLCLSLLRFFTSEQDEEQQIVLLLFVRYLRLCWRLQDVYNLEPAGSHGVWGLDDYSFLGYIFGSGQLCGAHSRFGLAPMCLRSLSHRPNGDISISDTEPTTPSHQSILHADYADPRVQTRPLSRTFFTTSLDCSGCAKLG